MNALYDLIHYNCIPNKRVFAHALIMTSGDEDRKQYYVDLIAECKQERAAHTTAAGAKSRKKRAASVAKKKIDLVGRRVIMSADVFRGNPDQCYHGVVISKGKYRQGGKTRNGFKVR